MAVFGGDTNQRSLCRFLDIVTYGSEFRKMEGRCFYSTSENKIGCYARRLLQRICPDQLGVSPEWRVPSRQGHRKLARHMCRVYRPTFKSVLPLRPNSFSTQRRKAAKTQKKRPGIIWSAVTSHRFSTTRRVASNQSAVVPAHSKNGSVLSIDNRRNGRRICASSPGWDTGNI